MNSPVSILVGKNDKADFNKIQDAINVARNAGGGLVQIQPGIYEENLILCDNVALFGLVGIPDAQSCVVIGTHTPPTIGNIPITNLCFKGEKAVFCSKEEGRSSLFLNSCFLAVADGYVFDLPNWKSPGKIVGFDIGDAGSKNNGFINNHKGATVFFVAATWGFGTHPMVISGEATFFTIHSFCPIHLKSKANVFFASGCTFEHTVRVEDEAKMSLANACFRVKDKPAICYNTSGNSIVSETSIESTGEATIEGDGSGILTLASITAVGKMEISPDLTTRSGQFITGSMMLRGPGSGLHLFEGESAKMGVCRLESGEKKVESTVVTELSRIFLTIQSPGGRIGSLFVNEIKPGEYFSIGSTSNDDNSLVAWHIIEPIID